MPTTLLYVEQAIPAADLEYILTLHAGNVEAGLDPQDYAVIVPVGHESGKIVAVLDDVALADFDGAARDSHVEPEDEAVVEARAALDATVAAFKDAGFEVRGELLQGDLVDGLKDASARYEADEIIVLTLPHFIEQFTGRDLASRARKATGLPTLRLLAHIKIGD